MPRVSPGYVETLGLRVVDGRMFGSTDLGADSMSVMVTEALASLVPALRALRIDPINALRGEIGQLEARRKPTGGQKIRRVFF